MKKITFLLIFIFFSNISGFSQIIYHAYSPIQNTYVVEGLYSDTAAYVYCDINNDSIDDFVFVLHHHTNFFSPHQPTACFGCNIAPLDEQYQIVLRNHPCTLKHFVTGDTIGNNLNWYSGAGVAMVFNAQLLLGCSSFHDFKYVPFKFIYNGNVHFGWFKIRCYYYVCEIPLIELAYAEFFLSEYAFNTEPNKGLIAGDTLTSLVLTNTKNVKSLSDLIIYPNPAKSEFFIDLNDYKNEFKTIEIYSSNGKLVKSQLIDNSAIQKIDIYNLNKGLYIVKLLSNDRVQFIKLIKN